MKIIYNVKRSEGTSFHAFTTFWSICLSKPQYIPPEHTKYTYIGIKTIAENVKIFFQKRENCNLYKF